MKIRFCDRNKGKGKIYRRLLEEHPKLDVKIKNCVKQCGACQEQPMVTVDKKRVTEQDWDKLYKKIEKMIKEADDNAG